MKKFLQWLPIVLLLFSFTLNNIEPKTQRTERHVIQFKIHKISTYEESSKIDAYLATKDGILASRTNYANSTYFSYTLKEKDLTQSDFEKWFLELGYSISCFNKIVKGKGVSATNSELENCTK
jgi:hypothetical protein